MLKKLYVNVNGYLLLVDDKNLAEAGDGLFFHVSPEHAGLEFVDYFIDAPLPQPIVMVPTKQSISTKVSTFFKEIFQEL